MTTKRATKQRNAEAATAPKVSVSATLAALEERVALIERCHFQELETQRGRDAEAAQDEKREQKKREFRASIEPRKNAMFDEFVRERLVFASYQKCFRWAASASYEEFLALEFAKMVEAGVPRDEREALRLSPDEIETRVGNHVGVSFCSESNHNADLIPAFSGCGVKTEFRHRHDIDADRRDPTRANPVQHVLV